MTVLEVYSRHTGRAGVAPCPGCQDLIVMCVYEPVHPKAGVPKRKRAFDYPPADRDDTYANHAAPVGLNRAHLITEEWPLLDYEQRLIPHIATHPQCKPYLTRSDQ